jgi:hypothetical protein
VPAATGAALVAAADELLAGRWETFGFARDDLVAPDWFLDPTSGIRAPSDRYAFRVARRSAAETGDVKQVWELSRHQHLTLLAAAFFVTGDARYAERVDAQLRSWWDANPFLSGVHWTSGIEVGLRLIAWVWIRRLLDDWPGATALFERNAVARRQIAWHQRYLARFPSRGTSANNHVIAEAAGQLVAACALPWFAQSERWRADAARLLARELRRNTFASGVNRELASEYHGFVAELAFCAAIEADAAGVPLDDATWRGLGAITDAAAALVDSAGRPPRQGDGDDGVALLVDGAGAPAWSTVLALGATAFGACPWWPATESTVFSTVVGSLIRTPRELADRPTRRPAHFADAGLTLLRTPARPEIWCRCDAGPHGFLATAAHAHADALAVEVRHDGVDVLADPGTYRYQGAPEWRAYFRSTRAHNTLELAACDQSRSGGPFLWMRAAQSQLVALECDADGEIVEWTAEHDGYEHLDPPAVHRRTVRLDASANRLSVVDRVDTAGRHAARLHFHLGPTVTAELCGARAALHWPAKCGHGFAWHATLTLPGELRWSLQRGETAPPAGWYSAAFGRKEPAVTLTGAGATDGRPVELRTELEFHVVAPGADTGADRDGIR